MDVSPDELPLLYTWVSMCQNLQHKKHRIQQQFRHSSLISSPWTHLVALSSSSLFFAPHKTRLEIISSHLGYIHVGIKSLFLGGSPRE